MDALIKSRIFSYFVCAIRLALGGLFIYSSIDKILNPSAFADIVANYQILPHNLINIFSLTLPWVEMIGGLGLLFGLRTKSCALIITLLTVMFIVALSYNITRGMDIACGCFSNDANTKNNIVSLIIRDIIILIFTLIIFKEKQFILSIDSMMQRRSIVSLQEQKAENKENKY